MTIEVVAVLRCEPGRGREVIESFREVSPLVHAERGCELYAAHLESEGDTVVTVERWTTRADLDRHSGGPAVERLNELNAELVVQPVDVWILHEVPLGDATKGSIPRPGR